MTIEHVDGPPVVIKLLEGTQGIGVVLAESQMAEVTKARGKGNLQDLLTGDETWTVS